MKLSRNAVSAAVGLILITVAIASAQVIKQIPSDALAVLKVSDLQATSDKIAHFATSLGISQMQPEMNDPLGAFLKQIGAPEGVNRAGELALAFIDPDSSKAPEDKSILILIPVSDYQKFIGNFPDAKPDGDLTQAHFKDQTGEITYFAHWGDYAAASPTRAIVATPPTDFVQFDGLAAKELDGKDVVLLGNLTGLRPKILKAIDSARQTAPDQIDQLFAQFMKVQNKDYSKFSPLAKVAATQLLDIAQHLAESATAASFSINLSPDSSIATTLMCQFDPATSPGQFVASVKNTDDSLLGGLAATKYLMYGGSSPQEVTGVWAKYLPPIQKAITDLGPDYSSLNDWLNAAQKMAAASQGSTFGWLMPSAPGAAALVQFVQIRHGDAKVMLDSLRDLEDAQPIALKALGLQSVAASQTYTKDSKIVSGISFDELKSQLPNMGGQSPQQMQIMQFMSMIYGPQGPDAFTGVVNDQTLLTVMGLDDAAIAAAITAAKAGDDPLAKTSPVKAVASQLPPERVAVFYLPLDLWATTGLGYAKMFGIDMGVTLPDNLPPMGTTFSTDASAMRADTYVPSQLIQAMTAAAMQVYIKTQNPHPGQPGGNGGAAPGGM